LNAAIAGMNERRPAIRYPVEPIDRALAAL